MALVRSGETISHRAFEIERFRTGITELRCNSFTSLLISVGCLAGGAESAFESESLNT